jgi:predicted O-methyltransferase YrrM
VTHSLSAPIASPRLARLLAELARSPETRGFLDASIITLIARFCGLPTDRALILGSGAGLIERNVLSATAALGRQIRNAEDLTAVAALLGARLPPLGNWGIEADFARLIIDELQERPRTIVECGSGASTILIAALLENRGEATFYSIEHSEPFASSLRARLESLGLAEQVQTVVAPLRWQAFAARSTIWYDAHSIGAHVAGPIDLLVVDGPPPVAPWARWAAMPFFHADLAPGAVVLLDDGRRRSERGAAASWRAQYPDLDVYWLDTVKGAWRVVKSPTGDTPRGRLRAVRRTLNPRPVGFGRWPVLR